MGPSHTSDPFRGVIDLIQMKFITFDSEDKGKTIHIQDIPDELRDDAEVWRSEMLEKLYPHDDKLMELAMEEQEVTPELIYAAIRSATIAMKIQPVVCGSALHGAGVQPLLDAVNAFLPSPLDRLRWKALTPRNATKF